MPTEIRQAILDAMERQGLTISEVAERAKMSRPNLTNYLNEKRDLRASSIQKLLDLLGLDVVPEKRKGR